MKKSSTKFLLKINLFLLIFSLLSSCSFLQERRSLVNGNGKHKKSSRPIETVPKVQYDQLLEKYESVQRKLWDLKGGVRTPKTVDEELNIVSNDLPGPSKRIELAETVDVFGKNGIVDGGKNINLKKSAIIPVTGLVTSSGIPKGIGFSDSQIESQIINLKRAKMLIASSKYPDALDILKTLGDSSKRQIKVRAKFLMGELLFLQNEHDLAMQVYEEIISKHAFSGIVFESLKRLIECSKVLKLNKKREQYYSILHDFFDFNR